MAIIFSGCGEKSAKEAGTAVETTAQTTGQESLMAAAAGDQAMPVDEGLTAGNGSLPSESAGIAEPNLLAKPTVEQIQQALKNLSLYQGNIDGKLGPKTKQAIKDFQTQNSLTADGKVGPRTWAKLAPYLNTVSAMESTTAATSN